MWEIHFFEKIYSIGLCQPEKPCMLSPFEKPFFQCHGNAIDNWPNNCRK